LLDEPIDERFSSECRQMIGLSRLSNRCLKYDYDLLDLI